MCLCSLEHKEVIVMFLVYGGVGQGLFPQFHQPCVSVLKSTTKLNQDQKENFSPEQRDSLVNSKDIERSRSNLGMIY